MANWLNSLLAFHKLSALDGHIKFTEIYLLGKYVDMAPVNPTDKPLFSFKEVVYIATLVAGYLFQQFSFKTEMQNLETKMHDAIVEQTFSKREMTLQISAVEKKSDSRSDDLEKKYNSILAALYSPADKPKPIKLQTEIP